MASLCNKFACELACEGEIEHNFKGTERNEVLKLTGGFILTHSKRTWVDEKGNDSSWWIGDNDVLKSKGDGSLADVGSSDGSWFDLETRRLTDLVFPSKPVALGQSWSRSAEFSGLPAFTTTYKLKAVEKIEGVDTFRININGKETTGEHKIKSQGTVWVEKGNGTVVKRQLKISFPYTLNYKLVSKVDLTFEFTRQASKEED